MGYSRNNFFRSLILPVLMTLTSAYTNASEQISASKQSIECPQPYELEYALTELISSNQIATAKSIVESCSNDQFMAEKGSLFVKQALEVSNQQFARFLIDNDADVNKPFGFGEFLLSWAVEQSDFDAVQFVVKQGATELAQFRFEHIAQQPLRDGQSEIARLLVDAAVDAENASALLLEATKMNDVQLVVEILSTYQIDLSNTSDFNFSLTVSAALDSTNLEIIGQLLEHNLSLEGAYGAEPAFNKAVDQKNSQLIVEFCSAGYTEIKNAFAEAITQQNSEFVMLLGTECLVESERASLYSATALPMLKHHNQELADSYFSVGFDINSPINYSAPALHQAVALGDLWQVEYLLNKGADTRTLEYNDPLISQAIRGESEALALLLARSGAPTIKTGDYNPTQPIDLAIDYGMAELYAYLLGSGLTPVMTYAEKCDLARDGGDLRLLTGCARHGYLDDLNAYLGGALLTAAESGDTDTIQMLLDSGVNADFQGEYQQTALSISAQKGNQEAFSMLLPYDYPEALIEEVYRSAVRQHTHFITQLTEHGYTPPIDLIPEAAYWGNIEIIHQLVKQGADINQIDEQANSALHRLTQGLHFSLSNEDLADYQQQLINLGIDTSLVNVSGDNALSLWLSEPISEITPAAMALINQGGQIPKDKALDYSTLLTHLLELKDEAAVVALFSAGVRLGESNTNGGLLIFKAIQTKQFALIKPMLTYGASSDMVDPKSGLSTLHYAAQVAPDTVVKLLLKNSNNIDQRSLNTEGKTPLMIAMERGDKVIIDLFLDSGADLYQFDNQGNTALSHLSPTADQSLVAQLQELEKQLRPAPSISLYVSQLSNINTPPITTSPSGKLAIRVQNNVMELWDETSNRALRKLAQSQDQISDLLLAEFIREDQILYIYERDEYATIIDAYSGKTVKKLYPFIDKRPDYGLGSDRIQSAVYEDSSKQLILSTQYNVTLIDTHQWRLLHQWSMSLREVAFSRHSNTITGFQNKDLVTLNVPSSETVYDSSIEIFDQFSKRKVSNIKYLAANQFGIAISAQGDNDDVDSEVIHIWDTTKGALSNTLNTERGEVVALTFLPDGEYFVALHKDSNAENQDAVTVWSVNTQELVWETFLELNFIRAVTINQDNQLLVPVGNHDIWKFDALTGEIVNKLRLQSMDNMRFVKSLNGNYLMISDGVSIEVWDTSSSSLVANKSVSDFQLAPDSWLTSIDFNKVDRIAAISNTNEIVLLNSDDLSVVSTHQPLTNTKATSNWIDADCRHSLQFTSQNSIMTSCWNEGIYHWNIDENLAIVIDEKERSITDASLSAVTINTNHQQLIGAYDDHSIKIWTLPTLSDSQSIYYDYDTRLEVTALATKGDKLYSVSHDRRELRVWSADNQQYLKQMVNDKHQQQFEGIALAKSADVGITWDRLNEVQLWDLSTGQFQAAFQPDTSSVDIISAAISPTGHLVVIGLSNGVSEVWNTENKALIRRLPKRKNAIFDITFSDDGTTIALASSHTTLWSAHTGEHLATLKTPRGHAEKVYFNEKADQLIVGYRIEIGEQLVPHHYIQYWDIASTQVTEQLDNVQLATKDTTSDKLIIKDSSNQLYVKQINSEPLLIGRSDARQHNYQRTGYQLTGNHLFLSEDDHLRRLDISSGISRYFDVLIPTNKYEDSPLYDAYYSEDREWVLLRDKSEFHFYHTGSGSLIGCTSGQINNLLQFGFDETTQTLFIKDAILGESIATLSSSECLPLSSNLSNPDYTPLYQSDTQPIQRYQTPLATFTAVSDNKQTMVFVKDNKIRSLDLTTGKLFEPISTHSGISAISLSNDGRYVAAFGFDSLVTLFDINLQTKLGQFEASYMQPEDMAFTSDNQRLVVISTQEAEVVTHCDRICTDEVIRVNRSIQEYDINTFAVISEHIGNDSPFSIEKHHISDDRYIKPMHFDSYTRYTDNSKFQLDDTWVVEGLNSHELSIINTQTGATYQHHVRSNAYEHEVKQVVILEEGEFALIVDYALRAVLVDLTNSTEVANMMVYPDNRWILFDSEGRYDSNSPGSIPYASWVASDNSLQAMPIELFLNQYFEPRLLTRILKREAFPEISAIAELNRVQPLVEITDIRNNPSQPSQIDVSLKVTNQVRTLRQAGNEFEQASGLSGIKLFRNGQQIGYIDETQLDAVDANQSFTHTFANIPISTDSYQGEVKFSAYAFNSDGVKSLTAEATFKSQGPPPNQQAKAYVFTIGVNEYQSPQWNLTYAAEDAKAIANTISSGLENQGNYEEVVSIPLISGQDGLQPTKRHIQTVLDLLSGKAVETKLKKQIPNWQQISKLTPNDMLFLFFAGHGLSDSGQFYLFPYDIGDTSNSREIDNTLLSKAISSLELDHWMRDIDAGNFILVIDACNSAASVQGEGFKPGPMGSRGLGQLAYNKGMKVLAASEAEAVALESAELKHGLLTYALIEEGIGMSLADSSPRNRKINSKELLNYGQTRVPELHTAIYSGKNAFTDSRGFNLTVRKESRKELIYVQKPHLFDFSRSQTELILSTTN
ncbi:ankyrin repeat domain-containing protein [Vibrio aestuarianus]|uniref:ankyrin repeat domain-containing protein n=1 Tax=Vibrio aestuarianus TaxID=28171 RepID=UPI00237CE659|nr:ankyrin repeat domain-containing protein [Vibrio aestuarianus]MDE1324003.1 ankyrin repeat domain-containing protein [Vibrio aestuarianus]